MKARLTELQSRQTQLAIRVSKREEYRDVNVENRIEADIVQECRLDTGEIINTRPARDDERQLALGAEVDSIIDHSINGIKE